MACIFCDQTPETANTVDALREFRQIFGYGDNIRSARPIHEVIACAREIIRRVEWLEHSIRRLEESRAWHVNQLNERDEQIANISCMLGTTRDVTNRGGKYEACSYI